MNIASGDYILYRPLYLVMRNDAKEDVRNFIHFAQSDEGQRIITGEGTVNLKQGANLWQSYKEDMKQLRMEIR